MLRLDKYLCELHKGTRSRIREQIKNGLVTVNGSRETRPERKIDENKDCVCFRGEPCVYEKYVYYMLNKPAGVVSATRDGACGTVTELLKAEGRTDLFPVGRLDKDAEGLLLLTNDGALAHGLLSPARHVEKVYYVELEKPLSPADVSRLEEGVDIGDSKPTRPAAVKPAAEKSICLTITEGRYHQVKRMLKATGNRVTFLKRVAMGGLRLDETLKRGEYRKLTPEEVRTIKDDASGTGPYTGKGAQT